jgi:WD40 repeat protein
MRSFWFGGCGLVAWLAFCASLGCSSGSGRTSQTALPGDEGAGGDALPSASADAGASAIVDATPGAADAPPGPRDAGTAGIAACDSLSFSMDLRLAPAAPGQKYVRCGTLGPEDGSRVAISPGGTRLVVLTSVGTARLLATDPWRELAQLAAPLGKIDAAAFSPDGAFLATLSAEMGEVALWNADDGERVRSFAGPPATTIETWVSSLAFSSDGERLATSLGTVIDLGTSITTDWRTGEPVAVALTVDPHGTGADSLPQITFALGDALLFADFEYQIGNSPPSTERSLRNPVTGAATTLFQAYSRALAGFAVSADRGFVALAITAEGASSGSTPGPAIHRADTRAIAISDPSISATVLGSSRDGARLFTVTGGEVAVRDSSDLHVVSH